MYGTQKENVRLDTQRGARKSTTISKMNAHMHNSNMLQREKLRMRNTRKTVAVVNMSLACKTAG